jgi:oxygen-dependent protoporphyrinogen oxidase
MKNVAVIGSGFSGLATAWAYERAGARVTVYERNARTGGMIDTRQLPQGRVETAANGLLASALVEELFSDCGIEVALPKKSARKRYIGIDGELSRWPLTFVETLGLVRRVTRAKKFPPKPFESLSSWADRVLGVPLSRKVISTAVLGIYAASADHLSASLIVGKFYDRTRLRNRPGRLRGTVSARSGMGEVVGKLRTRLETKGVLFQTGVDGIEAFRGSFDHVVIATSAWDAEALLSRLLEAPEFDSEKMRTCREGLLRKREQLRLIRSVPLISMNLFFDQKPRKLGFGTLFSSSDGLLGCLQNSEIFEGRLGDFSKSDEGKKDRHSETWILGGLEKGAEFMERTDAELVELVLKKREAWIDTRTRDVVSLKDTVLTRWPRAIPLYDQQLERARPILLEDTPGVRLVGNYLGDIGLASILTLAVRGVD